MLWGSLRLLVILMLMIAVLFNSARAATPVSDRKTVAVVLSGGGAKGVAHVGVLRALEENNVPIDYIAGTSMGAIVGGLYAAGFSPAEIEEFITSEEFLMASTGRLDKAHDYYFYHQDPMPVWISLNFRPDQALNYQEIIRENIPTNMISPGMMDFLFMEYLTPASVVAGHNFDSLFVPFRCIASDIEKKEALVMRNNSLAEAVRASMTFPLYFKPIAIDGKVLFDGGMYNNFPIDVVLEEFNPDIIIGSVVASNPASPCIHDVFSQLENLLMATSSYELPDFCTGIILHPNVPELSVTDFSRSDEVFLAGYEEALDNMGFIHAMINSKRFKQEVNYKRHKFRQQYPETRVTDVVLVSGDKSDGEFARSFLLGDNESISLAQLKDNYFRMLSINKFRHIYPRLVYNGHSQSYELRLELLKNNPLKREFGGNLSSRSINQFFGGFSYEHLGEYPATIYSNIFLGNYYNSALAGLRLDFFKKSPFYFLTELTFSRWNYASESVFIFEEQKASFVIMQDIQADFRWVFPAGYKSKIEAGMFGSRKREQFYNATAFSRSDTADVLRLQPLGVYGTFEKSTLNRVQYPTRGSFFNLSARYILALESYSPGNTSQITRRVNDNHNWWEAHLKWENFFVSDGPFRMSFSSEAFLSDRPLLANYTGTKVMARQFNPFPIAHTRYLDAFRANHFAAAGVKALYMFNRNAHIQLESHAFMPLKEILPEQSHRPAYGTLADRASFMHNAALVYHTAVGPVSLNVSYFDNEPEPWSFIINFGYILFNRSVL